MLVHWYLDQAGVLMVEARGTAPRSSSVFNSYHQIALYLYYTTLKGFCQVLLEENQPNNPAK